MRTWNFALLNAEIEDDDGKGYRVYRSAGGAEDDPGADERASVPMSIQSHQCQVPHVTRSFYAADVGSFIKSSSDDVVGKLATRVGIEHAGDEAGQIKAWRTQIEILKDALIAAGPRAQEWGILLELPLLRLGRRIDVVCLIRDWVACIEFKIGQTRFAGPDIDQATDYALCLRDFHSASHGRTIVPILCAERAAVSSYLPEIDILENVSACLKVNGNHLATALLMIAARAVGPQIDWRTYDAAAYNPTPNIVTAARELYAGNSVQEIGRADASGADLKRTAERLRKIVDLSRQNKLKSICFVTGEPGAGKTLLGLELVLAGTAGRVAGEPAALLSGNRPLVYVLQEAITEDARRRLGIASFEARRRAQQGLQTLLGYLKDHADPSLRPPEHVIVFDEAQRAWDAETGEKLLGRRSSEPELFLDILDRLPWACLVCLVGPGQEINRGEAGLPLWGAALSKANGWIAHASETALRGRRGLAGLLDYVDPNTVRIETEPDLHLKTNLRAYRNARHGHWVEALLAGEIDDAAEIAARMVRPPALVTRDLLQMKGWLKERRRGSQRSGLLASSGAVRLVADGIPPSPMSNELNEVVHWFLRSTGDFRSSNSLEIPLSEFVCQGLEVDYAGVCWGNDLCWKDNAWLPRKMRAPNWQIINKTEARRHRINAYRVLLTRGRAGTIIYLPQGDPGDTSRMPSDFDDVYHVLIKAGCQSL